MNAFKKVVVGISGGVDSAVTAYLIKQKGFHVVGAFMKNWDLRDEAGTCTADQEYEDAIEICQMLKIKLYSIDFVKQYWTEVFSTLVEDYQNGFTPNPDILCNKYIKFNHFFKYAQETLEADAVATGHYARNSFGSYLEKFDEAKNAKLLKPVDNLKDQTFFLSQISQESLRKTMFPLGEMLKSEVKQIASRIGLERIAKKRESMGICFIGNRKFQDFIAEYIDEKPGDFIDIDTNRKLGTHYGIHQWTLGQRARLPNMPERIFIMRKDVKDNKIFLAKGHNHLGLYQKLVFTLPPHWIHSTPESLANGYILKCKFKFQHVENAVPCLTFSSDNGLVILLEKPLRAVTPGQYAVFYDGNECLGSARIKSLGPSEYFLNYGENEIKQKVRL